MKDPQSDRNQYRTTIRVQNGVCSVSGAGHVCVVRTFFVNFPAASSFSHILISSHLLVPAPPARRSRASPRSPLAAACRPCAACCCVYLLCAVAVREVQWSHQFACLLSQSQHHSNAQWCPPHFQHQESYRSGQGSQSSLPEMISASLLQSFHEGDKDSLSSSARSSTRSESSLVAKDYL